jgi:hypothetical protein
MKKFHIFVEGDADRKFLHDYIEVTFSMTLNAKKNSEGKITQSGHITTTGGWTKLKNKDKEGDTFRTKMKENTQQKIVNLIIFDSDTAQNNGGYSVRKNEIEKWKTVFDLNFELFLFPNNTDDGALENLLEQIINPQNAPIFECWKKFEDCLPAKTTCVKNPLTIPAKKSKIYAYMEVLHGESKSEKDKVKDPNRDFTKPELWNLNATALKPLKIFLQSHLKT